MRAHETADVGQHRRIRQCGADDAGHRLRHPSQDDAVHQQAKVDGAKSAEKCGRLAGVANLGKLHIGEQARAPPQPGEQEDRHHAREQEAPPQPVPGNSLRVNQPGDHQWSVGSERGRHHGGPGQPPIHTATGDEVVVNAAPGAATKPQPHDERDREIADDGGPIEEGEAHGRLPRPTNFTMCTCADFKRSRYDHPTSRFPRQTCGHLKKLGWRSRWYETRADWSFRKPVLGMAPRQSLWTVTRGNLQVRKILAEACASRTHH